MARANGATLYESDSRIETVIRFRAPSSGAASFSIMEGMTLFSGLLSPDQPALITPHALERIRQEA